MLLPEEIVRKNLNEILEKLVEYGKNPLERTKLVKKMADIIIQYKEEYPELINEYSEKGNKLIKRHIRK